MYKYFDHHNRIPQWLTKSVVDSVNPTVQFLISVCLVYLCHFPSSLIIACFTRFDFIVLLLMSASSLLAAICASFPLYRPLLLRSLTPRLVFSYQHFFYYMASKSWYCTWISWQGFIWLPFTSFSSNVPYNCYNCTAPSLVMKCIT